MDKMNLVRTGTVLGFLGSLLCACSSGEAAAPPNQSTVTRDSLDDLSVTELSDAQLATLGGERAALRMLMTDAPIDAEHVYVTFCKVEVSVASGAPAGAPSDGAPADAGAPAGEAQVAGDAGTPSAELWRTVAEGCHRQDLLALRNGVTTELALDTLPAGSYGQIRLDLTEASIVVNGQEHPLTVPSAARSGLKIIHGFELIAGELTTLALDFDAARSIHETPGAGYIMRPVIELIGERRDRLQDLSTEQLDAQPPAEQHREGPDAGASRRPVIDRRERARP
jgi:hypothetical protein